MKSVIHLILLAIGAFVNGNLIVQTKYGQLEGFPITILNGRTVSGFYGVPFAAPPTGENRFADPIKPKNWNGVRQAKQFAENCIQYSYDTYRTGNGLAGVEDCLYLNVYTPKTDFSNKSGNLLPVVNYIHPGGYTFGSINLGPRYLLEHDVVLVTAQYRLGAFGFLSFEDETLPGNMGMKDQVAALKWIQENIEYFGGDPKQVTIAGTSAGGNSAQLHLLSDMSKGLFVRSYSMSGSALATEAVMPGGKTRSLSLAKDLGCKSKDTSEIISCLRKIPADKIIQAQSKFQTFYYNPFTVFGPVVETKGKNKFLSAQPYELLATGRFSKLPSIFGTAYREGLYDTSEYLTNATAMEYINKNWLEVGTSIVNIKYSVNPSKIKETLKKIRQYYFQNKSISFETAPQMIAMQGDRHFTNDLERASRLQAQMSDAPVHLYRFDFKGSLSYADYKLTRPYNFGTGHIDDVFYWLNVTSASSEMIESTQEQVNMIRSYTAFIASYVINGTVSVNGLKWPALSKNPRDWTDYMVINSPTVVFPNAVQCLGISRPFWDSLPINEPARGRHA